MLETTVAPTGTRPVTRTRDLRTFWRTALAILAPLPILALALETLVVPWPVGSNLVRAIAGAADAPGRAQTSLWLSLFFALTVLPATMAVLWTGRRGAPKLTLAAGVLLVPAFAASLASNDLVAVVAARGGLDPVAVATIDDLVQANPWVGIQFVVFLLGQTVGFVLLGLALWRARVVPGWVAIVLGLSGPAHLLMPGGNAGAAASWAMTAIGYAGASAALIRRPDADFDLPPGDAPAGPAPAGADARTGWRWLLALAAVPLALFVTVFRYLLPYDTGDQPREIFDKLVAATTFQQAALAVGGLVALTGCAGVLAVAWHTRRHTPLLTTVGLFLAVPGYLALFAGGPYADALTYVTGTHPEVDRDLAFALGSALESSPQSNVLVLVFVAGHLLGTIMIGVALWRARIAPTWLAIGLAVSQPIHLTAVLTGVRWLDLVGWGLTTVGFGWAAWRLARTGNDRFDLPRVA
ncbi:hypothetical protein Ais01nite_64180 [Asanoa ishikariensis]|uniref:Uncharacterized protein n=1 Tax=Asanoa ishikariensis TaxID=137265 RepID=A0A1H3NT42_9ACTN|nr:hypothetical protein [Asanoa ishikariensis]GIF68383.1 hypothetical protein Ais01nite_64180 [Asanoa ishikariensis]SDY91968.1 hypothetical protein SAMN05421684_2305 [Asanoa ishikariensis]